MMKWITDKLRRRYEMDGTIMPYKLKEKEDWQVRICKRFGLHKMKHTFTEYFGNDFEYRHSKCLWCGYTNYCAK